MGSLPNLNELGKDEPKGYFGCHKPSSIPGQCHYQTYLTAEERNKILHRHSEYNNRNARIRCSRQYSTTAYDDVMLEQMAAYSPISSRSTRNFQTVKRKDSLTSSIGATSVRRLIAVVRNTSSKCGPIYTRRVLLKNLSLFCISHTLVTSTILPFLALQGSTSIWIKPLENDKLPISINIGSFLLMTMHFFGAISSIFAPSCVRKVGNNRIFVLTYLIFALFFSIHLYPVLYVLIPGYILFGLALGPLFISRASFLMTTSTKLSYVYTEDDEDAKVVRRTCLIRRVSRAFQAAHDFGFIIGSVLSAIIITYTFEFANDPQTNANSTMIFDNENATYKNSITLEKYNSYLDGIFDVDEIGDRLCGAQACASNFKLKPNMTDFYVIPKDTATILIILYTMLAFAGLMLVTIFLNKIKMFIYQDPLERSEGWAAIRAVRESFKDVRLQLAAPLAVFIGLEQSFMYTDFSKSYVVCTLGVNRLNSVFLCMGLLQSIAAFTLSMLMRSIKRYYLIGVGFAFQCCLLLVQMLWKPMNDDPALFYVISAAWGVCNAVWEMLNYTLLTGLYMDNFEAAFANSTFFKLLGLAVGFGIHGLLCNWMKVYLLAFFLVSSAIPMTWLEIKLDSLRRIRHITRL